MQKAYSRITDESSKDYIDLVILNGDVNAARKDPKAANADYNRALEISLNSDPEVSEMRARAFFKRGANQEAQGHRAKAEQDYETAANIWASLEDHESAANAIWRKLCLQVPLAEPTLTLFNKERASVRVEALSEHLSRLSRVSGKTFVARRSTPSQEYWTQKIKEAKLRLAPRMIEL